MAMSKPRQLSALIGIISLGRAKRAQARARAFFSWQARARASRRRDVLATRNALAAVSARAAERGRGNRRGLRGRRDAAAPTAADLEVDATAPTDRPSTRVRGDDAAPTRVVTQSRRRKYELDRPLAQPPNVTADPPLSGSDSARTRDWQVIVANRANGDRLRVLAATIASAARASRGRVRACAWRRWVARTARARPLRVHAEALRWAVTKLRGAFKMRGVERACS